MVWLFQLSCLIRLLSFPFSEYDDQKYRVRAIHALVHKLPEKNRALLDLLTNHLYKYAHTDTRCLG